MNSKLFVEKNLGKIEEALTPLVAYMENPNIIDFDEDIISIVYYLITHNQKLTKLSLYLIQYLYKYCEKIQGLLLDMYELVNAYLAYGTEFILSNEIYLNGIYKVFEEGIKNTKYKNSPLFSCLLIQTWIINRSKIPENLTNIILQGVNEIMKEYNKSKSLSEDNYNFLGFVTTILSSLINYPNIIITALTRTNNANSLKYWLKIIDDVDEPGFEYEIKIIIYSLCMIIKKGIIKNDINDLLNMSIDLLKTQEYNSKYEIRKNEKKKYLKINFEDDSEQSDDDKEDEYENNEYNEIKDLIEKTINPIKNMDEYKIFNELLLYLKNFENTVYSNWEKTLDENRKALVNKLFGTKRINITEGEKNFQVPRRIVSIKRPSNNNQ